MYKISIPISMNTLLDGEDLPRYLDDVRRCGAERVFLCGMGNIYTKNGRNYTHPDAVKNAIDYFRAAGLEVGVWISAFGHGKAIMPELAAGERVYTQITDVYGVSNENGSNCPMDENFVRDYCEGVRRIAELSPDMIMLDDDFRLTSRRGNGLTCLCPLHMAEYRRRIGEDIPLEKMEKLLLTGRKNRYRSEFLKLMGDSMRDFIKALRCTIDSVNPNIRFGVSDCYTWDMHGTDPVEIAKMAAGKNKPFARTIGAPYHSTNIIPVVESTRQFFAWAKDSGVEIFAEGDTYPRPRHNVPSKTLELFDLLLLANGGGDGILAYVEDYSCAYDYERGYVERFVRNKPIREGVKEIFDGKSPVGARVYSVPHKMEDWDLGDSVFKDSSLMIRIAQRSPSFDLLSSNSVPTSFADEGDYPLYIIGENARHVDLEKIGRGAILDAVAAKILAERGVDTGLLDASMTEALSEYYFRHGGSIGGVSSKALCKLTVKEGAEILSELRPNNSPASYLYENASGQRFYVLAIDLYKSWCMGGGANFLKSYYRQADITHAIEYIAGKRLPVVCERNPNLYILASKDSSGAMAVALANVWLDDIFSPEIRLDKDYTEIRFINCTGTLCGDRVTLSDIPPYGFSAFEVR